MQPLSGNQRPDLLTSLMKMSLMKMSLVLRLPREMHLSRSSSDVPRLPLLLKLLQNPHVFTHFWQDAESLAPATQNHIWTFKSGAFNMLTWKCASRHNGVHFFDILTSKSGPELVCFVHFDLDMCFTPQRRAILISHLARWLRTQPSGATNHWKNTVNRDFSTFSRTCIFFLLTRSLLWSSLFFFSLLWLFLPLLFHLSILSEVWLLDFLR